MDANKLYEHVRELYRRKHQPYIVVSTGISGRAIKILENNGLAHKNGDNQYTLDYEEIKKSVLNGNIWAIKGMGISAVKQLCQYIVDEEEAAGRELEL